MTLFGIKPASVNSLAIESLKILSKWLIASYQFYLSDRSISRAAWQEPYEYIIIQLPLNFILYEIYRKTPDLP